MKKLIKNVKLNAELNSSFVPTFFQTLIPIGFIGGIVYGIVMVRDGQNWGFVLIGFFLILLIGVVLDYWFLDKELEDMTGR